MSTLKKLLAKIPGALQFRYFLDAFGAPLSVILKNHKAILNFKNKYAGQRCFIIGNGPSLKAEDLDKIQGEYSFAANRIYKIFSKTDWRPTFYCVQDENVLLEMDKNDMINTANAGDAAFLRMHSYSKMHGRSEEIKNLIFVPIWYFPKRSWRSPFSKAAEKYIFDGWTVTYMSMQLAAFMGFSEIYLLGVDNNMPYHLNRDGEIIVNDLSVASHFYDGVENNIGEDGYKRRTSNYEFVTNSYQSAEEYSRKHGIFRIYNATRGGILEVFERVNFDEVVKQ